MPLVLNKKQAKASLACLGLEFQTPTCPVSFDEPPLYFFWDVHAPFSFELQLIPTKIISERKKNE